LTIGYGTETGHSEREKYTMPVAENNLCYESSNTVHIFCRLTNGSSVQNKWNAHNFPALVADDPTAPNLH
jgi:hypothetical protein